MSSIILSVSAEQQLLLKLQSMVVMTIFGLIAGLALKQVVRATLGDGFIDASPSRQSPWR
ncbi:hypothetical protein DM826_01550 [Halonotius aquaticus]|jgi:hypothetical protein|uniref:Uncharacterized protein n=1 Tax=Halonotius aquaticus TaxID=2216978 RepID=A0A3A6Q624_9EURY|nr:hypothetical protein [Halonotius aquaticus]RJX44819.1 hypothetical protein DM826_01550 [Halonotius aquaticus]